MVKKRYTFSSSEDEPSESPPRGRKKPSLAPPPRALRTKPHIDLSSDDDLFRRRPKDTHQDVKARPSSKQVAAENSSSDSEFEFNYKKALKRHNDRRQTKQTEVERKERDQADKGPDWCSSCSGSVCGDCTKAGTKKQGKLLARVQNERMEENELVRSREFGTKNVEGGGEASRGSFKRSKNVEPESMESSEDDGLMASKSYRLLERHLRRKESERAENQAFSTNDEPLRKTFEENLTPRKQSRHRYVWDSDSGEELTVQRAKHNRPGAVARSRGVVHAASSPQRQGAHRGESEEDTDEDLDLFDRNLGRRVQNSPRIKCDQRLAKVSGFRRREQHQLEHKKKKPKHFTLHEDYVQFKKPMVSVLEGGPMERHISSEQVPTLVWDRKKHKESLAKLSDFGPHEWRRNKRDSFAEVNDSACGRYKDVNDGIQERRVYLRDQATSPIKSRVPSPERGRNPVMSKKGIDVGTSHTSDRGLIGPSMDSGTFAKVAGAACTVLEWPSFPRNQNESQLLFRHDPGRDANIPPDRSRSARRRRSPSQRTHSAPASECRGAIPNESDYYPAGINSTPHSRSKQRRRVEDEVVQQKSTDSRRQTAPAQEGSSRGIHQSAEYHPDSDGSRDESAEERREAIEPRPRSWCEGASARRSREIQDKRESSRRGQTEEDPGALNSHEDPGGALAPIGTQLDINKASEWNSFDDPRGISPRHGELESTQRPTRSQPAGCFNDQDVNVLLEKTVSEAVRIVGDKLTAKMSKRDSKVEGLLNGCMDNCVQLGGEISDLRCSVQTSTARQQEKIRRLIEEARPINQTVKELQEKFQRGNLNDTVGKTSQLLKDLSIRLDHLESRMAGQLDRLSKDSQQTMEDRISQTQSQPSGSQEARLQDLENTIHELKNTICSSKTVARLEQEIRRVQGEVGQCLEEVVDCRSENKGSLMKMRDNIAHLEEDFRRTTSEARSKIDFLETKMGSVHDRVRALEKAEASAKSGIRRTEHKIENVEILVEQVAAACNATVKAVDQKHLRFKNSLRVIKEAAAVTNAKCDALAEAMAKLHKDTVGRADEKSKETRDTRDALEKVHECHHDREYLAHVTVERTGKEKRPGDSRKQRQYLVKDKGPILQTPGARTVEVIPSKPPVERCA